MKFEDMIASGMLQVLNSKEHASLFKKAYKEESSGSSDNAWAKDTSEESHFGKKVRKRMERRYPDTGAERVRRPSLDEYEGTFEDIELGGDDNRAKDKAHKCTSCKETLDVCNCGGGSGYNMADDTNAYTDSPDAFNCPKCESPVEECFCKPCKECKEYPQYCKCNSEEGEECPECGEVYCNCEEEDEEDSYMASDSNSKKSMALNIALENLLKASAALDYCNLGKGSELAVKVATLVSQAKKGKVDLTGKREESAKKHLRKLRDLAEEESSLPKGRGESKSSKPSSKSSKPTSKKPTSKKKVSKASSYDEEKKFHSVKSRVSKLDHDDLTKLRRAIDGQSVDLDNHLSLLLSDVEDLDKENFNQLLRSMGGYAHAAKNRKKNK